jgi:flagellin-like protein
LVVFFMRLRGHRGAVSPVVSTVLLVAITVVLAAVLFVIVSSMLTPPPAPPVAITFTDQGWSSGTNTMTILTATSAGSIPVSQLDYIIQDSMNTIIFSGKADEPVASDNVTVTVHYEDIDGGDRISPGDRLQIIVDPISGYVVVDGGALQIYHEGKQLASHSIA